MTSVCLYVSTIPLLLYVVSALLINKLPGNGVAFVELEVNLKFLVPVPNLNGGVGLANGFLNQNAPPISPKTSVSNLVLTTLASAPLVLPTKTVVVEGGI